jgi:hypothetical protein
MKCSLHAKYRYVDRLPTRQNAKASFGTIMHLAIQHYYDTRGDANGTMRIFKTMWADPAKAGVEPDYWPKHTTFNTLMAKGIEVIRALDERMKWNNVSVIGTEVPFLVPFGEHELTGFVDLITVERSGTGREILAITDHKTAGRKPPVSELALDVQFTAYIFASFQRAFWVGGDDPAFPGLPNGEWLWETVGRNIERRAIWHHLYTGQLLDAGPRTTADFQRLYRVAHEIERATQAGIAVPTIGESCELEIPVAIAGLEDPSDPTRWI